MLGGALLVGAISAASGEPEMPPVPSVVAQDTAPAVDAAALAARDQAQVSRGLPRATPVASTEPSTAPSDAPSEPVEPSATVEPSTVEPEPTPEPTPSEPPEIVGEMWATQDVNVRSGPGAGTERLGFVAGGQAVGVTGETTDGWTQVVVDGRAGWVNGSYLTDSEPAPEPEPEPEAAVEAQEAPAGTSDAGCSISPDIESNLTGNARAVYRATCAAYGGSVSSFGGYRPGDGGDHGSGRAVDIMVSGPIGWEISRFLQSRAGELGITYIIYEQQIWMAGSPAGAWEWMEDRGGATANHYDHVHVSVS
jgi:SH3-like domain-containing protein